MVMGIYAGDEGKEISTRFFVVDTNPPI